MQQIVGAALLLIQLGGALADFLLELLVQHGVVDGNGDLAGKQREQVDRSRVNAPGSSGCFPDRAPPTLRPRFRMGTQRMETGRLFTT